MAECVYRLNLKTGGTEEKAYENRPALMDFCLGHEGQQYLAIGWSYVYDSNHDISSYREYYYAVKHSLKKSKKRIGHVLNVFWDAKESTLFWTRDLNGDYWICRAKETAKPYCDRQLDIGAILPVEAYLFGHEVPGQIKASFNRPRSGTAQTLRDEIIVAFSKYAFNKCSGRNAFDYCVNGEGNFISNLPDFELEELVISYIQIKHDYYLLSNSIANKSTSIKIECEFRSRNLKSQKKAVVQVKGPKYQEVLSSTQFQSFVEQGYEVFVYAPLFENDLKSENVIRISQENLEQFYEEYKAVLPDSITMWENIFTL